MSKNPHLQQAIAEAGESKSVSGKLTASEYARFTNACSALGINKNTAAQAILRAGIDDLEHEVDTIKAQASQDEDEAKEDEAKEAPKVSKKKVATKKSEETVEEEEEEEEEPGEDDDIFS